MEVEEMKRKEPQAEIPWIPTTPVKPVVPKSAPICTPVEGNSQIYHQANGAFACSEFPHGTEKNRESHDGSVPAATITDIAGENGKICDKTASDNVSCWSGLGSSEFVFRTEVASSSATQIGDNNGLNDLVVPSVVSENSRDPHETSDIACCSKRTSQDDPAKKLDKDGTPPDKELCDPVVEFAAVSSALMENHNPDEGSSLCTGLNKTPEKKPRRKKHRPKVIREGKPKRTPKPATPKPAPSKENTTGKRKYVRRKELKKTSTPAEVTGEIAEETPEAAKMSCQRSLNFDIGTKDESSAGRENITALLGKENGVAAQETNFGLICDLNTSVNVKHASNSSMSLPEETHETKPKENPTGKRKYIRRKLNKTSAPPAEVTGELTTEKMPELAKPPCKSCTNFDKGGMEESSAVKETATAHLSEENVVTEGTNPDLAYDVKTPMKQASDSNVSLTEDTQTINKSSRRKKLKEGPITKRQYERRSKLNKSSTPTTEVSGDLPGKTMPESAKTSCQKSLNFDRGARDESSADKENATVHPCKETGAAIQEIGVGFGYDMESFMKQAGENNYLSFCNDKQTPTVRPCEETGAVVQEIDVCLDYDMETFMKPAAENNYMSFCNNEQTTSTSPSKTNPPGEKPKQNLTGNKYQRRKRLNKSPTCQTEMTGEDTGAMMPESKATPMKRFSDVDMGVKDESSAHKEIVNVQMGDLVEETPVSLAYNQDTWIKQALNSYMSGDAQAPSTDPSKDNPPGEKPEENPNGKRKCVKKMRSKRTSTPREMTDELTEPIMSEPTVISCRMSINFDNGGRDESNMCNESLASDQNTLVKEMSNSHMSLSENTQAPSACLPKSNPPGAKRNPSNKNKRKGLPTAEDGNISNGQVSTIESQMVGCEREHSGTTELADNNNMNLIGAHYNGLHSYQSKFPLQFPNIQKKKRTEKEKTNTCITSSVIAENGVPLMFSPQYAQVHPYASNYNSWMYGSGYNTAVIPMINECTENYIHNTQTFDEFRLSLRRVTERSQFEAQTSDYNSHYNSLMRIRSCVEPDYTAKQLEFSDRQTIRDEERPQTCIDVLVEDMPVSCAKKKQNKKRSVISSSAHPNTDEMQQCHNFALVNHNLAQGKSSDTARRRKKARDVEALTAQFRRLNINTGEKDLVLYKQNALVPFQGSFDPIKKQRPRPKVDLDEETDRVWKLLLLDINHEGVDGTDEDKAKWWEEERNVFRGRAESFIARMHLVQGDRRFSRWKGSVVDSVVGVFLTQNVSDHLSSSAFMALAARYPKKSGSTSTAYDGEGTSLVNIVEPEENTECDVKLLNQSVCNQSSMTVDIVEHSGNDSCRITSSPISLTDESNCKLTESPQTNITECHSPMVMIEEGEEKSRYGGRKELNDIVSSQSSVISFQISGDFSNDQNPEKIGSCSDSNSEIEDLSSTAKYNGCGSFSKLLEMVSSTKFYEVNSQRSESTENMRNGNAIESSFPPHNSGAREVNCSDPFKTEASSSGILKNKDGNEMNMPSFQIAESAGYVAVTHSPTIASQVHPQEQSNHMQQQSFFNISGQTHDLVQKERNLNLGDHKEVVRSETNEISSSPIKPKSKSQVQEEKDNFDWDSLRIKAQAKAGKREKTEDTMDSLDWEALRCADVGDIANTIKERGMNNRLAERIQKFLNRVVEDHGSIDLEWLRDVPPDQAKEYLLSVRGLGLKSVECVRLLTLHHLAFPVDTNVGRIAVRLGWVPLQPLPESLQLHLLEMYPVLESIQKYLWPRLCKLDQKTLYELHYQMITFGKVFCTKSKPNCNACPMRAECRHFASAFASARLALPGPEQKNIVSVAGNIAADENPPVVMSQLPLPLPGNTNQVEEIPQTEVSGQLAKFEVNICQPIIEEPASPEPECPQVELSDIEDSFYDDKCEIPTIELNIEEFTLNLQNYMQRNMELQDGEMSKALVALNTQAASIPVPKLKNVSRLRTEHCVYELPDNHPLLEGWETREPDDPGKYLLAIWTPGETADSTQAPECKCSFHEECGQLCNEKECFSCNSFREANSQIVRGTLLIPCRTAMRGSFPLNGTYFQVNEVFADHESSLNPVSVPRSWIWNLGRRTVYFGTSTTSIFKGLTTQEIQQAFWRGYICVRGFERKTRAPRPLMARLHFPASKLAQAAKEKAKESSPAKNSQVPKPNPESTAKKSRGPKPNSESTTKKSQVPKPNADSLAEKSPEPKPDSEQPELILNSHSLQEIGTA
ncbi:DNA glycosylase/AP lyase ROS1-like [Trifolium pratense]|uniref:DNA glycosylase/AP lyase ROS1-like n=1 Tax=Trifolium pratense TaxID=57577 RepID=UPI001E6924A5|nr:DNA glycosylase/AP lyase ROS1-like [Trifolium pratense]